MRIVPGTSGESHHELHDDCPICRALRESGELVFALDALGQLVLVE